MNRPLYVSSDGKHSIWFDGDDEWRVGFTTKLNAGKINAGLMRNRVEF